MHYLAQNNFASLDGFLALKENSSFCLDSVAFEIILLLLGAFHFQQHVNKATKIIFNAADEFLLLVTKEKTCAIKNNMLIHAATLLLNNTHNAASIQNQ